MASLDFKVYKSKEYLGALKEASAAAAVVAHYAASANVVIKWAGIIVWREGKESQPARRSFTFVADTIYKRIAEIQQKARQKGIGVIVDAINEGRE